MNYLKIIISFIALSAMVACQKDYLERYPLDTVSEGVFFNQVSDMKIYMNQFYNRGNFPIVEYNTRADLSSDINMTDATINTRLRGTNTINSGGNFDYTDIRAVNYFLENYKKCDADFETYKQYVGEAYFFRAFFYFGELKMFGGVPWIPFVLKTTSPELYSAREPRNVIADNIIADLDTAAMYLSADKTNGCSRINKWIALLYQSRVALYEGTWEKYHNGTAFGVSNAQPAKYFNKAAEAASAVMNSGLYDVYSTGKPESDYFDFFGLRDYSSNKEVLFWVQTSVALNITTPSTLYHLQFPEQHGLTKSLADSYLCKDGVPIATSPLFKGYANIVDETTDRDPRFKQTIFTPDAVWYNNNGKITYWSECYAKLFTTAGLTPPTGYTRRKSYNPNVAYHSQSGEEAPSILFRYAEVLLNYAEAKAELGTITQGDIDISIKKLRNRVGMPNLTLAGIPTDPNWDFPTLSPVINEIRRERKIELCLENLRLDDIMRWAAADELIIGKRPKGATKSQFTKKPSYPADEKGFIDVFQVAMPNGWQFNPGRDYLYPVSESQIVLNPNLTQNPGWE
ncbi:MAG: carbohydrate-binding protein SusD [Bacteroidetes bacterium GWF2_42_66]|nr:MAG: carbohydrate-binding protein SusD [Bacteroidetes bacterium GWA2_42_15]OFX97279.1 MAG: carbohydrate-binding protein SusD [Bacteroidetes bacterium GWE2_42_39]OFY39916.1 MAG: carbohydrate-binding protein SusD [Bacteroidetes bacterium GWF2_42_66]HBL78097.1 RagB/SusD family nutrient uptake outer membrane protein [Prolixibacteraceae bacterium]HCR90378.1 RagB/SusD family nutrient uptake outer membrane protein [Prolixibacteraceae bacterium]